LHSGGEESKRIKSKIKSKIRKRSKSKIKSKIRKRIESTARF